VVQRDFSLISKPHPSSHTTLILHSEMFYFFVHFRVERVILINRGTLDFFSRSAQRLRLRPNLDMNPSKDKSREEQSNRHLDMRVRWGHSDRTRLLHGKNSFRRDVELAIPRIRRALAASRHALVFGTQMRGVASVGTIHAS
jgi:hypothetical protein